MSPRPTWLGAVAGLLLLVSGSVGRADTVPIFGGTGEPGSFEGSLTVTPGSNTWATITVTLKNTSPADNGGFITGFAFNDPNARASGDINAVTNFNQSYAPEGAPPANYMTLLGVDASGALIGNSISGSPYGSFDLGAAVGGDLLGSGAPQPGVEVGQTGTFVFTVTGQNMNNLTAANLLAFMSEGGVGASFMVRFRGFEDGSSDKVVIGGLTPPPPVIIRVVPAPPAVLLAGIGLGCCLLGRVFRRKATA